MDQNLKKLCEGVEAALSLKQSDFGVLSTHYFELLKDGFINEHDMYIAFKKVEKFTNDILPMLKDHIDETKLNVEYKKHNVSLVTQGGRAFYDYSNCNDHVYDSLSENLVLIKDREKYLQAITKPTEVIDEETGEVFTINPPIKRQGVNIVMRYEKK